MIDNEVLKAIRERRSIRRFKPDQIKDEELKTVLEAGTWAPTGMGKQDPWIVALQDKEQKSRVAEINAEIMGVKSDPYYNAPTIVFVFAPSDCYNYIKDGSLVLENMMLAAHSIGLASCWINREDGVFKTEYGKSLLKKWGLTDENLVGIGALSLGYPASYPHTVKPRKADYYRIIK